MKKLVALIFILNIISVCIYAQDEEGVWFEGYAVPDMQPPVMAKRLLEGMLKKNPDATLEDAKIKLAERAARLNAYRNRVEYENGIEFVLEKECVKLSSQGNVYSQSLVIEKGLVTDSNILPSKVLLFRILDKDLKRDLPKESKIYEATGEYKKIKENLPYAIGAARTNAFDNAVKLAIKDKFGDDVPEKVNGKIYIVKTVTDSLTEAGYSITLQIIVVIYEK